jgi:hypothetical protein
VSLGEKNGDTLTSLKSVRPEGIRGAICQSAHFAKGEQARLAVGGDLYEGDLPWALPDCNVYPNVEPLRHDNFSAAAVR